MGTDGNEWIGVLMVLGTVGLLWFVATLLDLLFPKRPEHVSGCARHDGERCDRRCWHR